MIDPVEYGELKGKVGYLAETVQRMDEKLDAVLDKLAEQRGGWKATATIATGAGGLVAWLVSVWQSAGGRH